MVLDIKKNDNNKDSGTEFHCFTKIEFYSRTIILRLLIQYLIRSVETEKKMIKSIVNVVFIKLEIVYDGVWKCLIFNFCTKY